ncbi:hypothetical protein ASE01_14700 [Nocardioides sp. Root190]|uniref:nuclear transport factor 2 family protein n=1 Tax=Nocardioides sp. Root190 TaxID=1736488 RepID=UPI0006FF308A|nr:nuclear transport factor 2 family protein [Nocardioides sp. Root190]KRB76252.1 hypothetical protein ASE01_14700 [Nocardioides sp. Root190]
MRARLSWRAAAVGLVIVALLAVAAERGLAWRDQRDRGADEKAVVAAAQAEVEGLIDISGSTSEDDMARLLDGATADFRKELESQADRLRKALADNAVEATGEAVSSGVVRLDGDRATVIVAAVGTVTNKQTEAPEPRNYRLKVDLLKTDDAWLVSGLEFVS